MNHGTNTLHIVLILFQFYVEFVAFKQHQIFNVISSIRKISIGWAAPSTGEWIYPLVYPLVSHPSPFNQAQPCIAMIFVTYDYKCPNVKMIVERAPLKNKIYSLLLLKSFQSERIGITQIKLYLKCI
jgi:hypothetical protein